MTILLRSYSYYKCFGRVSNAPAMRENMYTKIAVSLERKRIEAATSLFTKVQNDLTSRLAEVDGEAQFEKKSWDRPTGGGGTMAVLRGKKVEKAGVNVSTVWGSDYPALDEHKGKPFYAAGVSTIGHMFNPHAPIGHMNIRMIAVGDQFWVGGGADLTPYIRYEDDVQEFHARLRDVCEAFEVHSYYRFSKWCDEYFFIKHRNEIRGIGGIFFDYLTGDFEKLLNFLDSVAMAYCDIYPRILKRRVSLPFTEVQKEGQLYWRGRYAEFNLVYDRGTKFGLMTGGNIDAIFVSLPPVVKW